MKASPLALFLAIASFLTCSTGIYGQEQPGPRTDSATQTMKTMLTFPKPKFLGVYFVPEYQYGQLAGQFTSMGGGSLMVLLNKKLGIGVSGYTTMNNFTPSEISTDKSLALHAQFGGAKIEYTLNPNSRVHVSFPLLIGGGRSTIDSAKRYHETWGQPGGMHSYSHHGNEISFYVIQPGVNAEANLFRFMKVFAGASYRFVSGGETRISNSNLSSPPALGQMPGISFSAGIKLGYDFYLHKKK